MCINMHLTIESYGWKNESHIPLIHKVYCNVLACIACLISYCHKAAGNFEQIEKDSDLEIHHLLTRHAFFLIYSINMIGIRY